MGERIVVLPEHEKIGTKKYRTFECAQCGHIWQSYSLGKFPQCPKCYESRTGRRLGKSDEHMQKMRAARMAKREAAALAAANSKPTEPQRIDYIPFPNADDGRQTSILDRIMNAKMFWAEGE